MSIDANDPRLTAYALNELDETERARVDRFLESSVEGRQAVDEIRQAAEVLANGLADETTEGLSDRQRKAIESRIGRRKLRWLPISAVASVLLLIGFAWFTSSTHLAREVADRDMYRQPSTGMEMFKEPPPQATGLSRPAPSEEVDMYVFARDKVVLMSASPRAPHTAMPWSFSKCRR